MCALREREKKEGGSVVSTYSSQKKNKADIPGVRAQFCCYM